MVNQVRESLSGKLLQLGVDSAFERQELERGLAAVRPNAPGYHSAAAAMAYARAWEKAVLWVGWRLQPRSTVWH